MSSKTVSLKINSDDDVDVDLVRLMEAVSDIQRALRCIVADIKPPEGLPACAFDKDTRGYYLYFVRLACGHLHEGLAAFRRFCTHPKVRLIVKAFNPQQKAAFDNLFAASDGSNPDSFFKKELSGLRSDTAFHYPAEAFKEQMALALSEDPSHKIIPKIISGRTNAETYYQFADDIMSKLFMKQGNHSTAETMALMENVKKLQFDFILIVDAYLAGADMVDSILSESEQEAQ